MMASAGSRDPTAHPVWPSSFATVADKAVEDLAHLPGFGSVPPKLVKKIVSKEYRVLAARVLAGTSRWLLLPHEAVVPQSGDRHKRLDGVLRPDGG